MSATPLIDEEMLGDMVSHIDRDALRPIVELFAEETSGLVARIVAGAAEPVSPTGRGDVRAAAHSLKSSAGQLGGAALSETAAEIERAAEAGAPLAALAAEIERSAAATVAALTALLAP